MPFFLSRLEMEDSIFVTDDRTTPLLQGYDFLQPTESEEAGGSSSFRADWSSDGSQDDSGGGGGFGGLGVSGLMPPAGNSGSAYQSVENTLSDIYRYYWLRGLWKFVMKEIGHMIIMTWLVLFCVFLGSCVDYGGIASFQGGHAHQNVTSASILPPETSVWQYIRFSGSIGWYFIVALVLYSVYGAWRIVRFLRDLRRLVRVRVFYRDVLKLSDFELRTARWADVLARLPQVSANDFDVLRVRDNRRMRTVCQSPRAVAAMITKREDAFKRLLQLGLVDFVLRIPMPQSLNWPTKELSMLTRGLQWNLMHCVVNFFFDSDMQLRTREEATAVQVSRLRKRVVVLAIINVLLLPFLVVFVALYAIFRYGEQFYKDPSSVGARQWSPAARWYFRDYNEMPHVFEERLRLSSRFAKHYTKQFAAGAFEGLARAAAFILGSIVVWLLTLSFINEHVLLSLDISPGKSVLWWITVLSGGWVVFRSLLQQQHVFYPRDALTVVHNLVRHLPPHFMEDPSSRTVLQQFYQLFPLRVVLLVQEFAGLVVTPWLLLRRVYPNAQLIVDTFHANTRWDQLRGHYIAADLEEGEAEDDEVPVDLDERKVLQSVHLVPYLQNLDTAMLRVDDMEV